MNVFRKYWKRMSVFRLPYEIKPPYSHIIQIGDPVLRDSAVNVNRDDIKEEKIQKLIKIMTSISINDNLFGLSAPQVGVPLRVFTLQITENHIKSAFTPEEIKKYDIHVLPLQVWINPEIRIIDYRTNVQAESCGSILSLKAHVKRYNKISLNGFDENNNAKSIEATDFIARVIQHEVDHLNGILFTDIMNSKSLCNVLWKEINELNGYVELNYFPKTKF